MKKLLPLLAVALLGILVATALIPRHDSAPPFSLPDLNGNTIDNNTLQGKVSLMNFWFPSCPGCVSEMPKLIRTAHDYQGKDFQILAVAVPVDALPVVQEYAAQKQLPFTVMFDGDKTVTRSFVKTDLYPTSVLLNKRGEIINVFVGEPDFGQLYRTIDEELAK